MSTAGLLEVIALSADDARRAQDGGADRIELLGTMTHDGLSPGVELVEQARAATEMQIRVMLRLRSGFGTEAGEIERLRRLGREVTAAGADGLVAGFLTEGRLDADTCAQVVGESDVPWTLHRAIDAAGDAEQAWQRAATLGCDQVLTAGSPDGVAAGLPELLRRAAGEHAALVLAGGGLQQHHVPALAGAGVRAFHIGSGARRDQDFANPVEPALVARWRAVLDEALAASD